MSLSVRVHYLVGSLSHKLSEDNAYMYDSAILDSKHDVLLSEYSTVRGGLDARTSMNIPSTCTTYHYPNKPTFSICNACIFRGFLMTCRLY